MTRFLRLPPLMAAGLLLACEAAPVADPGLAVGLGFGSSEQNPSLVGGRVSYDGIPLAEGVGGGVSLLGGVYGFEEDAEARILRMQLITYHEARFAGYDGVLPGYLALGFGPAWVRDEGEDFDAGYVDVEFGIVDNLAGEANMTHGIHVAATWSLLLVDDDGQLDDDSIFDVVLWCGYRFSF